MRMALLFRHVVKILRVSKPITPPAIVTENHRSSKNKSTNRSWPRGVLGVSLFYADVHGIVPSVQGTADSHPITIKSRRSSSVRVAQTGTIKTSSLTQTG
jgi:hypothetical protein